MAPGLQNQDAIAVGFITVEQVLRENSAEAAAADDDRIERAGIVLRTAVGALPVLVRAVHRFIEAVAHVATENVSGEVGELSCLSCGHVRLPAGPGEVRRPSSKVV